MDESWFTYFYYILVNDLIKDTHGSVGIPESTITFVTAWYVECNADFKKAWKVTEFHNKAWQYVSFLF